MTTEENKSPDEKGTPPAPQKPAAVRQILVAQTQHYRNVFASTFRVKISKTIGSVVFANDEDAPDGSRVRMEEVRVTMLPVSLKALHVALTAVLEKYETDHGPMDFPAERLQQIRNTLRTGGSRPPTQAPTEPTKSDSPSD